MISEKTVRIIEDFVNSHEGCDIVDLEKGEQRLKNGQGYLLVEEWNMWLYGRWEDWENACREKLLNAGEPTLPDQFWEDLIEDLVDWEHNGNMRVWEEGETNDFGMTRWKLE